MLLKAFGPTDVLSRVLKEDVKEFNVHSYLGCVLRVAPRRYAEEAMRRLLLKGFGQADLLSLVF